MFMQELNFLTGRLEWVPVQESCENNAGIETGPASSHDPSRCSVCARLASSSYLDMLNDERRNRLYEGAIAETVKAGDQILDIG